VFPRVKTGVERRIPLWPETGEAIQAAIAARPRPKADEDDLEIFEQRRAANQKTREARKLIKGEERGHVHA
jgi:integrase